MISFRHARVGHAGPSFEIGKVTPKMVTLHSQHPTRFRPQRGLKPDGFTLIEVILALFLSVIVMFAITSAIYLHLQVLERRRGKIERAQLARNILQRMASDIRSAVQYKPVDVSQLEQMMSGADLTSLLDTPAGEAAAADVLESGGSDDLLGGAAGADSLLGGGLDGGLAGGLAGDSMNNNSSDIAGSVAPPTQPGIYGNEFELQVDTSRLPRKDEYNPLLMGAQSANAEIPSDIKTIAYYFQEGGLEEDLASNPLEDDDAPQSGLVRREVTRAVARYALDTGGSLEGLGRADLLAPEVTLVQYRYFDGTDWVTEWDSEATGALPFAIEIQITLTAETENNQPNIRGNQQEAEEEIFRLVVHLPMAEEATEEAAPAGLPSAADLGGSTGGSTGGEDPAGSSPADSSDSNR